MRLVSLVPAATEWLVELGLTDSLVGISHESADLKLKDIPVLTEPSIKFSGSSSQIDFQIREQIDTGAPAFFLDEEALVNLRPDLVICQQHCGICAVDGREVAQFAKASGLESYFFDPINFRDILKQVLALSNKVNRMEAGMKLVGDMEMRIESIQRQIQFNPKVDEPKVSLAMIEWIDPIFVGGNWIPQMMELVGIRDAFQRSHNQSEQVSMMALLESRAEHIIIAPCDFSIEDSLADMHELHDKYIWKDLDAVKNGEVYIADGLRYFNKPGPGIIRSLELMALAIYKAELKELISVEEDEMTLFQTLTP